MTVPSCWKCGTEGNCFGSGQGPMHSLPVMASHDFFQNFSIEIERQCVRGERYQKVLRSLGVYLKGN